MNRVLKNKLIDLRQGCEGLSRKMEEVDEEWLDMMERICDGEDNGRGRNLYIPQIGNIFFDEGKICQYRVVVEYCVSTEDMIREKVERARTIAGQLDEVMGSQRKDPEEELMDEVEKWREALGLLSERVDTFLGKMKRLRGVLDKEMMEDKEKERERNDGRKDEKAGMKDIGWMLRLPPVSMEKFSGKRSDFPLWWAKFETTVGCQPLSDQQKMLYLLDVVPKQDRAILERLGFQDGAYEQAAKRFKEKYSNNEESSAELLEELLKLRCRDVSVEGQRELWDKAMIIVEILQKEGISDGFSNIPEVIKKFSNMSIREKVTRGFAEKKQDDWEELDRVVKEVLDKESRVECMKRRQNGSEEGTLMTSREVSGRYHERQSYGTNETRRDGCFVCGQMGHRAQDCRTIPWNMRRAKIREEGRCIGCLEKGHFISECQRADRCPQCERQHSRFIPCESVRREDTRNSPIGIPSRGTESTPEIRNLSPISVPQKNSQDAREGSRWMNVISVEDKNFASTVWDAHYQSVLDCKVRGESGEILEARILVDSGSEMTYIDEKFAQKLECESVESKTVKMRAFGNRGGEVEGKHVKIYLEDVQDGGWLIFYAMTGKESLCQSRQVELTEQDKNYLRRLNKPIPRQQEKCPDIILGGAYYIDILTKARTIELPSKNRYIETMIGNTVTRESLIRKIAESQMEKCGLETSEEEDNRKLSEQVAKIVERMEQIERMLEKLTNEEKTTRTDSLDPSRRIASGQPESIESRSLKRRDVSPKSDIDQHRGGGRKRPNKGSGCDHGMSDREGDRSGGRKDRDDDRRFDHRRGRKEFDEGRGAVDDDRRFGGTVKERGFGGRGGSDNNRRSDRGGYGMDGRGEWDRGGLVFRRSNHREDRPDDR